MDFPKIFKYQFCEHPSCGSQAAPGRRMDGQTDIHDGANSCLSQCCKHA